MVLLAFRSGVLSSSARDHRGELDLEVAARLADHQSARAISVYQLHGRQEGDKEHRNRGLTGWSVLGLDDVLDDQSISGGTSEQQWMNSKIPPQRGPAFQ